MRTVMIDSHSARIGHAKSILESDGIPCFVHNELSHAYRGGSIVGPLKIFDPELKVVNDDDYPRAMELLEELMHHGPAGSDWKCPACGEMVPGSMGECWACQAEAPAA